MYRFCAQSMRYPEPSWLTDEYLSGFYLLLDALESPQEKEILHRCLNTGSDCIEELQIEYTRLFINSVPHVIAPPYGSVYMDKSLFGRHAEQVQKFYARNGYSLRDDVDLPDHISHQLEFLSILAENNNQDAETEFLQSLFRPWFTRFYARVMGESTHPFYSTLVQLIDYFTKEDDEHGIQLDEA